MKACCLLAFAALLFITASCSNSEGKGTTANSTSTMTGNAPAKIDAQKLYNLNCKLCHGAEGNLGLSGAKDLTASTLTKEERISIISNGKGGMSGYSSVLSKKEIAALADFLDTFKKAVE